MESSLSAGATGEYVTPDQMLENALRFYREATKRGFRPEQIFYDTTVMPLAIEFTSFDRPGYTYCSFEGLRKIMDNEEMLRRLSFVWGVRGLLIPKIVSTDDLFAMVEQVLKSNGWAESDDLIVVTAGVPTLQRGTTNMVKVHRMGASNGSARK